MRAGLKLHRFRLRGEFAVGLGIGLLAAVPDPAWAGNGLHPRTPTLWDNAPMEMCGSVAPACMVVVDRSADPVLHLPYALPFEDTEVTLDEVEDSRRHQFFAACRDPGAYAINLPTWINQADLDAADAKGLLTGEYGAQDVLETSDWAGCLQRITPDDARRPIACAQAEQGVDWDTSLVPAGTYKVFGYTWEPEFNQYWPRSGVVKVVDGPDLADAAPGAALQTGVSDIPSNDMFWLEVCVSAMPGSTVVGSWTTELAGTEQMYTPFTETCVVEGGTVALEFDPPEEARGQSLTLRVDVTDDMGRTYTAYSRDFLVVDLVDQNACPGQGGGGFVGDSECHHPAPEGVQACPALGAGGDTDGTGGSGGDGGTGTGVSSDGGSGEGTGGTDGAGQGPGSSSCACSGQDPPGRAAWLLAPVLVFATRRRYCG
jgi:hypothetical protein